MYISDLPQIYSEFKQKSWKNNVFKKVTKDFLLISLFEHTELGSFFSKNNLFDKNCNTYFYQSQGKNFNFFSSFTMIFDQG